MIKKLLQKPLLGLLLGAVLTALILVFPSLGFLQWFSMIPLFWGLYRLEEDARFRYKRAYWYGFLTVYAYYFVLYHWFTPVSCTLMCPLTALITP